jgi:sodium transport system permease protein
MQDGSNARDRTRLNWRQIAILYQREMRAALRERTIVINSILIPIFLYPLLLWVAFTLMTYVIGQAEGARSRVVVRHWPEGHPGLRRVFERDEQIQLLLTQISKTELNKKLRDGEVEAAVEFTAADGAANALENNFSARIAFDQSRESSSDARDRVRNDIESYRADWLKREARSRSVDAAGWQGFTVSSRNVASKKQMGTYLLGLMLPVIFVVMVAIGCFNPAVDAIAGERERNTWETLMSTAANRINIVAAKYLYVVSLGGLAGCLNLIAVVLTFKPILAPLLERAGDTIESSIPIVAIPIVILAGLLLAGFVAAGMMIFASFARTFKEGQAMITPFYLMILLPVVFLQVPGLTLSPALACVPVINVTLLIRETVSGTFHWLPIGITIVVSVLIISLCIRLATFILKFEDVMTGSYSGSFVRFAKERIVGRKKPIPTIGD